MRWFKKERPPDIPDIPEVASEQPIGDIEAAQKIREICASAELIAEKMAALAGRKADNEKAEKERAVEAERYQAAVKRALEIARQISDDSMRDISVSQIIRLCVKLDHLKTARVLLRAIQSQKTRAELIAESPVLVDHDAAN
jgi:hypothetical protein